MLLRQSCCCGRVFKHQLRWKIKFKGEINTRLDDDYYRYGVNGLRLDAGCSGSPSKARSTLATMSKQHCRTLQVERFFPQCRMLLRHCCRFWQQCRTKFRHFDNVETNWTSSICFDFVERTKFYNRIVRHYCRLWQQSRMLLRQSRTLLRQCCWCGRGLTNAARLCQCGLHGRCAHAQSRAGACWQLW